MEYQSWQNSMAGLKRLGIDDQKKVAVYLCMAIVNRQVTIGTATERQQELR
jgi:hypothetical protein